jgi:hypothetical protein
VFHAVRNLREAGKLQQYEEEQDDLIRRWFSQNLAEPTRFTASKLPFYRKQSKAISWFKDSAHEHLLRVRELVMILEHHGISVRMLKTDRVGYVVYEDEYQNVLSDFGDPQSRGGTRNGICTIVSNSTGSPPCDPGRNFHCVNASFALVSS